MAYADVLYATNNYMCLGMGFIWTIAYAYAGYKILS